MTARLRIDLATASGFTLVELLISVSILGLLMTAAFGSLTLGSRSWERSIDRADENQDLRRSVDFVRRQFAHLTPLRQEIDGEPRIVFTGEPDVARFVSPAPESVGGGLVFVTLAIERTGSDVSVAFSIAPFNPGLATGVTTEEAWQRTLFTGLADARIDYFGAPTDRHDSAWHGQWQSDATNFPAIVHLQSNASDGSQQPELFFRIRAEEIM